MKQQHAIDSYMIALASVRDKLIRLNELEQEHFGVDPDALSWGDVGDLGRINRALSLALGEDDGI